MGYLLNENNFKEVFNQWSKDYVIYAPKKMAGEGMYSDTDVIRYEFIQDISEIEFEKKSDFSFKEALLPISETLFYFTEDIVKEAETLRKKGAVIFLRSCDLHAIKRLDEMYLKNGYEDYYYKRLRKNVKFAVIGCTSSFTNCFCVSMGTNKTDDYDIGINFQEGVYYIDSKWEESSPILEAESIKKEEVHLSFVLENEITVNIPGNLSFEVSKASLWKEYDSRCINCGRCNFVCPTCTCFSMQDIFYTDNGKVGERRRVHASCMVDGYTDMAGGGAYRKKNGERMRFKVLHKVYDYKKRNGYHMCVGCGRCDDVCPEYISFSGCVNRLKDAMKEVKGGDEE
jgi:anaerobic sulfite reductase subunit A